MYRFAADQRLLAGRRAERDRTGTVTAAMSAIGTKQTCFAARGLPVEKRSVGTGEIGAGLSWGSRAATTFTYISHQQIT
jgi:hypothetical protein